MDCVYNTIGSVPCKNRIIHSDFLGIFCQSLLMKTQFPLLLRKVALDSVQVENRLLLLQ